MRVVVVGSFTIDYVGDDVRLGGPLFYSAYILHKLGYEVVAAGAVPDDIDIPYKSVALCTLVPKFRLRYLDSEGKVREVELVERGCVINLIPDELIKDSVVIVNTVINEVPYEVLRRVRDLCRFLAIDIQGFVRRSFDGKVAIEWSDEVTEVLALADVIHADISEVPIEPKDPLKAALYLRGFTDGVVTVTMGSDGSVIAYDGKVFRLTSLNEVGDPTGAGDIFLAVLAVKIAEGMDPLEAALYSTVVAGLKVRYSGFSFPNELIPKEIGNIDVIPLRT